MLLVDPFRCPAVVLEITHCKILVVVGLAPSKDVRGKTGVNSGSVKLANTCCR